MPGRVPTRSGGTEPPSGPLLSLPKGGGAIRGIGEKFSANALTGTGNMQIPIAAPAGRAGFAPGLALTYDSGTGNGPFGIGWQLDVPAVTRRTDRGLPRYLDDLDSDVYLLGGGEDLVPWLEPDGSAFEVERDGYRIKRYRPRIEGGFARIERRTDVATGDVHWRTISPDNVVTLYGASPESRITDPHDDRRVFSWLISEARDDKGNAIVYVYEPETSDGLDGSEIYEAGRSDEARAANRYVKRIKYGNQVSTLVEPDLTTASWMFEVVFDYDEEHVSELPLQGQDRHVLASPVPGKRWALREDAFTHRRATFPVVTYRRCHRILVFHNFDELGDEPCLVSSTDIDYADFDYTSSFTADDELHHQGSTRAGSSIRSVTQCGYVMDDVPPAEHDGVTYCSYLKKSLPPVNLEYSRARIDDSVRDVAGADLDNLPVGLDDLTYQFVDLDGEGLSGILSEHVGAWFYKRNLSALEEPALDATGARARFAPLELVSELPYPVGLGSRHMWADLAGNGRLDVTMFNGPLPGFAERTADGHWEPFRAFDSLPNVDWDDPELRFVDLTGDGLADVLVTEDEAFTWYASLGEAGFARAERVDKALDDRGGPRLLSSGPAEAIALADMSGDGLTDIVRVRNGDVSYFPNLGYGRFGARVTMADAPWLDEPDQFDPRRIRLADLDGSGVTDLVYLDRHGVRLFFNQAGSHWSKARVLPVFPGVDDTTSISIVDLLGNGTSCLVWSSSLPGDAPRPLRYVQLLDEKPHLLKRVVNNVGAETLIHYAPSTKFYLQDKLDGRPWVTKLPFPVHLVERVESIDHVSGARLVSSTTYHHGYFDGPEREFRGFAMIEQKDTEAFEDYVLGVTGVGGAQELAPELYQPPVVTRTWFHTGAFLDDNRVLHQLRNEYYLGRQHLPDVVVAEDLDAAELREAFRALKGVMLRQEVSTEDETGAGSDPYVVHETSYEVKTIQRRAGGERAVFMPLPRESVSLSYESDPADPRIGHSFNLAFDDYGNVLQAAAVVYGRANEDASLPAEVTEAQGHRYVSYQEVGFTGDVDRDVPTLAYRLRAPSEVRCYELTGLTPAGELFTGEEVLDGVATAAHIGYEATADGAGKQLRLLGHDRVLYLDDDLDPLPLGELDALGLVGQTFRLAVTPEVAATAYAGAVSDADFAAAGYVHFDGDDNWWIASATTLYPPDPGAHFYLPSGERDAFGLELLATLDQYDLLTERVAVGQAAWAEVHAVNDYRVLGPVMITDPNKNQAAVAIDALGMVTRSAVMGKAGAGEGDTLADPTSQLEYDAFNWMDNGLPNYVHTLSRNEHSAANTSWSESFTYSNGSGGVAMTKTRVKLGRALRVEPDGSTSEVDADPRWLGTGRAVVNNKGNPVKRYDPYFSATSDYEDEEVLRTIGRTPVFFYDALGRNTLTRYPNGTLSRVEFDSWTQQVFDANDTVKSSDWYAERGSPDPAVDQEPLADPERRAAWLAAKHDDTPNRVHLDSLGRAVMAQFDLGGGITASTRGHADLTGRTIAIFDQEGREVSSGFTGMAGMAMVGVSSEKGRRWSFQDVFGTVVKTWDEHGRELRTELDLLRRPLNVFVKETDGTEVLIQHVVYGDRNPAAEELNLFGAVHMVFDQAGLVRVSELDFKRNPKLVSRILAKSYSETVDWTGVAAVNAYADIQPAADALLETGEVFDTTATYDAMNRPTSASLPDGTIISPTYDEGGLLESLQAKIGGQGPFVEFLQSQDHDAKGRRLHAHYGNGIETRYTYDPDMSRLAELVSSPSGADPVTAALQRLLFTYDPVGNITQVRDEAQQTLFFNNAVVEPQSTYEYDALYQLVRASGREAAGGVNDAVLTEGALDAVPQLPHANDAHAVRAYTEEYEYDLLGNVRAVRHRFKTQAGVGAGWTRHYRYAYDSDPADPTNRLTATSRPGDAEGGPYTGTYAYDAYGNMTKMPHLAELEWNSLDQLRRVDLGGGGTASYVYGSGGKRIRKVVDRNGTTQLDSIYLGAVTIFRRRRRDTNTVLLERHTVHIADDAGTIAQVDTKKIDVNNSEPASPLDAPLIRYQYGNHIGSGSIETDEDGRVISYEEYHPYGSSAYRSAKPGHDLSLKRFRYSGKELDDESGLYYFGARYYAPWLGRWTSSDPGGFVDGPNLYAYCRNNPVGVHDSTGYQGADSYEFKVQHPSFIGGENPTIDDFKQLAGDSWDPRINQSNARIHYEPAWVYEPEYHRTREVPGGTWVLTAAFPRPQAPRPPPRKVTPPPPPTPPLPPPPAPAEETAPPTEAAPAPETPAPETPAAETPAAAPETGTPGTMGTSAGGAAPSAEKFIWNQPFKGPKGTYRGNLLEYLYGVPWKSNTPKYDLETPTDVRQVKSTERYSKLGDITRSATRDAEAAIKKNSTKTMTGKAPRAVIITPTDAPASVSADIADALTPGRNRKIPKGAATPEHVRGLPGRAGTAGRAMLGAGLLLSGWALAGDIERGDVPMGIGDALGVVGGGLEVYAIAGGGATVLGVSAMTAGLVIGGLGIAVVSGVGGYRAYEAGDTAGAVVGGIGVGAGLAIAAGAAGIALGIAGAPVLLAVGAVVALGVGAFHLARYMDWL